MRLTVVDGRTLGVSAVQPAANLIWNWSASDWEPIASAGAPHVQQLAPMTGSAGVFANIISADLGVALDSPGAAPVVWQLGAGGTPASAVDWNSLSFMGPNPQTWNWPR